MGVGALLYLHHRLTVKDEAETLPETDDAAYENEECCGLHITCERDSLSPVFAEAIEYFDDEELDGFAGLEPQDYTADEIELFRDVLLTLRPEEIAPWVRSVQQRGIELPGEVRDEIFLIVDEARTALSTHPQ